MARPCRRRCPAQCREDSSRFITPRRRRMPSGPAVNCGIRFRSTADTLAQGHALYSTFCFVCHGEHGKGDGPLIPRIPNPPAVLVASRARHGSGADLPCDHQGLGPDAVVCRPDPPRTALADRALRHVAARGRRYAMSRWRLLAAGSMAAAALAAIVGLRPRPRADLGGAAARQSLSAVRVSRRDVVHLDSLPRRRGMVGGAATRARGDDGGPADRRDRAGAGAVPGSRPALSMGEARSCSRGWR